MDKFYFKELKNNFLNDIKKFIINKPFRYFPNILKNKNNIKKIPYISK